MDRAVEHLGEERAGRYLRKFYPWYLERLGASKAEQERFQRAASLADARALLGRSGAASGGRLSALDNRPEARPSVAILPRSPAPSDPESTHAQGRHPHP